MDRNTSDIIQDLDKLRNRNHRHEADQEFARMLEGKSVVVVGPARTLVGTNQGKFIDSHDVVVRINDVLEHLPLTPDLAGDLGTRADIIYCNQVILRRNILNEEGIRHRQFFQICRDVRIKGIVCTNNSLSYDHLGNPLPSCPKHDRSVIADFRGLLERGNVNAAVRVAYTASEALIRWLDGNYGRTGFVAIVDLLGFGVRRLSVTGMTFYHGGGHLLAPESAVLHPQKNRDGSSSLSPSGKGHDSFREVRIMNLLMKAFGETLAVDEPLSRLLHAFEHPEHTFSS